MKSVTLCVLCELCGKIMKNKLNYIFFLLLTACCLLLSANAQTPEVQKVEPPNWWANSTVNPVRVMIRGNNLKNATVQANTKDLKTANVKVSENGHYLFVDVAIAKKAKVGKYNLKIVTANGASDAPFEISAPMAANGRFQGFTPDDVIYFLMPDRFADGDESNNDPAKSKGLYDRSKGRFYHGGDLQGVIDKLPYLKSLGVTAIWTTPIYDNNDGLDYKEVYADANGVKQPSTGYHGYGATDFYGVDEHLGDLSKVRELIDKAHSLGLKVIQDQVVNHTSPYHVWANDPPTPTWHNGSVENHLNNNWQKWTTMNPRATFQTQQSNLDGWFIDILPDLNQNDPEVEKYLIQNTIWWLNMTGFDAVRMDTLPHVPRTFWAKWMTALKKERPNVNVLGELYDGDPSLLAYFQAGHVGKDGIDTKIDTLYDYSLFYPIRNAFAGGGQIRSISQMLAHDWLFPKPEVLVTFLGLHDMGRFMSEQGATVEGLKLAQTFIMTTRGTPLLYYGDELAMRGGGDPENRQDFSGGFRGDSRNAFTPSGRTAEENDVWNHLAILGKLRQELAPLRNGKSLDLYDGEQQAVYSRFTEKQAVIVVFNNETKPATIEFSVSELKMLPNGTMLTDKLGKVSEVKIENGMMKVTMPARTAGIFTMK